MKKFLLSPIIMFILYLSLSMLTSLTISAQYLSNGSFEIHRVGQYPEGHTGNGFDNYHLNQLMKCINECNVNQYPYNIHQLYAL